jgi:Ion channel
VGYLLLLLSATVVPFASYGALNTMFAIVDAQACRKDIPLIREADRRLCTLGWTLWATGLLAIVTLSAAWVWLALATTGDLPTGILFLLTLNAVLAVPIAVLGLCLTVWTIAADENLAGRKLLSTFLIVCLFPPLGIERAKMTETSQPRARALWGLVLLSWVTIYLGLAMLVTWTLISQEARWTDWVSLAVRYVICGLALGAVALVVRQRYEIPGITKSLDRPLLETPARPVYNRSRRIPISERVNAVGVSLILLAGWAIVVIAAGLPWIHAQLVELSQSLANREQALLRLSAILLAAVPVTALSLRILVLYLPRGARPESGFLASSITTPVVMSALIVAVTFVFAGALLEDEDLQPLTMVITGFCVGLSAGLSLGIARNFGAGRRLAVFIGEIAATGFCAIVIYALALVTFAEWPQHSALPSMSWFLLVAEGVLGFYTGAVLGGAILVRGFLALWAVAHYLDELLWRLVGFVAGYIFVILLFGGIYFFAYGQHTSAVCNEHNFALTDGPASRLCQLTFKDFAYFSMNTIAPMGYSEIRPASQLTRALTALELGTGIAWTVVVFGVLLTHLTEEHIRKIISEALGRDPNLRMIAFNSSGRSADDLQSAEPASGPTHPSGNPP